MPHNPSRLIVVQRADALVVAVHAFARRYRHRFAQESPGLRNQLVRAVTSVSLNIGEACGYHSVQRVVSFLEIAIGSCNEVERILLLCAHLGFDEAQANILVAQAITVRRMTYGFRKRILKDHEEGNDESA